MPTLDLALGLGMIGSPTYMIHTLVFEPFREITGDIRAPLKMSFSRTVGLESG